MYQTSKIINNIIDYINNDIFIFLLSLVIAITVVSMLDFLFGWTNAKFNSNVVFESNKALYGIIKKIQYIIVLIVFLFIALLFVPLVVSVPALTTFYIGFLFSEINSLLSHLGLTKDGKKGELFIDFMKRIMKGIDKK